MEIDVRKRRNQHTKRRERAQRMQAERDRSSVDSAGSTTNVNNSGSGASRETGNGTNTTQNQPATVTNTSAVHDSADEDMATAPPIREKPPPRRKKQKEQSPLLEEDIVDGFAILAFKTYEDLEVSVYVEYAFRFVSSVCMTWTGGRAYESIRSKLARSLINIKIEMELSSTQVN